MAVPLLLLMVGSSEAGDFDFTLDDITMNQQHGDFYPRGDVTKTQKAAGSLFEGNTSLSQHFALLSAQPGSLLVGGRGVVYNLSLPGLHEMREEVNQQDFYTISVLRFNPTYNVYVWDRGHLKRV